MKLFGLGLPEMLIMLFVTMLPVIVAIVVVVLIVRALIRYNAKVKREQQLKDSERLGKEDEIDKTIINDL